MPKLKTPTITRHTEINPTVVTNPYDAFAAQLSPLLYRYLLLADVNDIDRAHDYMMRQLAWESDYGRSKVARELHNYGGYGWNGKTYTTFKSDEDFIKAYVNLMTKRYKNAINAPTIDDYGHALKQKGYYQDTEEHYTDSLKNMRSISRATSLHKKNNPDMYKLQDTLPVLPFIQPPTFNPQPVVVPSAKMQYNPDPFYGQYRYIERNTAPAPQLIVPYEKLMEKNTGLRNTMMRNLNALIQ